MRTSSIASCLWLLAGCQATTQTVPDELPEPADASASANGARTFTFVPGMLRIDYQGDHSHRIIALHPPVNAVQFDGVSDRTAWPTIQVSYRVQTGARSVRFLATSSSPVRGRACREHFMSLRAEFEGRPVDVYGVILPERRCALEIRLDGTPAPDDAPYGSLETEDPPSSPRPSPSPF